MTASISGSPVITVKFLAPTKRRDARIKVILSKHTYRVYAYDHEADSASNHLAACEWFLLDLQLGGDYVGSCDAKGVWYFVDISKEQ